MATVLASFVGFIIENRVRHYSKDPDHTWILGKLFRPFATRNTVEDRQNIKKQEEVQAKEKGAASDVSLDSKDDGE